METRLKRGDAREDGMVFWAYGKGYPNGEYWVTPEKFAEIREASNVRRRNRYANDSEYRDKVLTRTRTPKCREKNAARRRDRRANDPLFAASFRIRVRTRNAFHRIAADKPASTEELLGTDWQSLKNHIESQFVGGMSWENMSEWHIDHIVPLASAKTEDELAALCHYTNLQPLWASDNLSKGAKLPEQLGLVSEGSR